MHRAALSLGANLGHPAETIERAIEALNKLGTVTARSKLYRTAPWGVTNQPDFINAAVLLETHLGPRDLLDATKALEKQLGRVPNEKWGPRIIDIDILTFDDDHIDEGGLTIPHPRMLERAFVLVPLAEIDARYIAARDALPKSELEGVCSV